MARFDLSRSSWTKIASAGATVEVQALSDLGCKITLSAALPAADADGAILLGATGYRKYDSPLPFDLYATAPFGPASLEVLPIGAAAGGGGGGGGGPITAGDGAIASIGSTSDAASASGANTTVIGALRAIRDKLLGGIGVTGTFWQSKQPVSAADGDVASIGTTSDAASASGANTTVIGALRAIRDKLLGTLKIRASSATVGTQNSVAAQTGNTNPILTPNANRVAYRVYNDSTAILYLLCATGTPSYSNYTVQIAAGGYFQDTDYTGIVQGVWAAANGNARVTELT